jgi:hypothetical protein
MAEDDRAGLILFVSGGPGSGEEPHWAFVRWLGGTRWAVRVQRRWLERRRRASRPADPALPSPTDERSWHLPREVILCVNLVLEIARDKGKKVTVVDVNRAGDRQPFVDRWVGPTDVLPLFVRTDGARLAGCEKFLPRRLRQFIDGR